MNTQSKTRYSILIILLLMIYAGAVVMQRQMPNLSLMSGWGLVLMVLSVVGLYGPAVTLAAMFAVQHPAKPGQASWLMPGLWAVIFSFFWFILAQIIPQQSSLFTIAGHIETFNNWSDTMNYVLANIPWAILSAGLVTLIVQPIVYLAHRRPAAKV